MNPRNQSTTLDTNLFVKHHRRETRFEDQPTYYASAGLWLYGNTALLFARKTHIKECLGARRRDSDALMRSIEERAEAAVLNGQVLVTGIHNGRHQQAAVVPLRFGAARIVVFTSSIRHHLGEDLRNEPFPAAQLWRFRWDAAIDLAVSLVGDEREPAPFDRFSAADALIVRLATFDTSRASVEDPFGLGT